MSMSRCKTFSAIRWLVSSSINSYLSIFSSFHRFANIKYISKICYFENIGEGHDLQHSQWRYLMARVNLYKRRSSEFFASSHHFPYIKYCDFQKFWPWKYRPESRCTTFVQWRYSMASVNLHKSRTWAFFTSSHRFPDIRFYDFQQFCDLEFMGQGHYAQHVRIYISICMCACTYACICKCVCI